MDISFGGFLSFVGWALFTARICLSCDGFPFEGVYVCFTMGFGELTGSLGLSLVSLFTRPMRVYAFISVVSIPLSHKYGPRELSSPTFV
jgi:hypothetical protein